MWIASVDVPESLLDAARSGRLVVFVGAGASRDSPADLPDFRTLTKDIASDAQIAATEAEFDHPDVLLGRIADSGVNVHQRVASRVGAPTSRPNALHEAIVDLAIATKSVRIVTTNYDRHISTSLAARGLVGSEYCAPALPMGDDFTGVVYLHGSLIQEPRHLVVTDSDFGRAYLRDAWASRFLERMFASFTVLFVGYSHGDVVMRYLARSLGPQSDRYVLTPDAAAPDWRQLNIHTVSYELSDGSHRALHEAMSGWARHLSMGLLDHRQRLAQLLAAPPSHVPEEVSYLEAAVRDGDIVKLFVDLARGEAWLRWVAGQESFAALFDPAADARDATTELGYWFVEHYVMDEDLTSTALDIARDAGGRLGSTLWHAIGWRLNSGGHRPAWLAPWLVLMIEHAPSSSGHWLEYALVASRIPEDRDVVVLLFDHLTEPHLVFDPWLAVMSQNAPRFAVEIKGSNHWLHEAWTNLVKPNIDELARPLLSVVDRHLRKAHQLLSATGSASRGWDPISFGRSSIAPHSQDRHPDAIDILIDAARDCVASLLAARPDEAVSYANAWAESEAPILRRLAVYTWTRRRDVDAAAKLRWLSERGWLFAHELRHEAFELLAAALPSAAEDAVRTIVAEAEAGPSDADREMREYERFNLLAWLERHSQHLAVRAAFDRVRDEHPDFAVREHPDLVSWSETGVVRSHPPMEVDELHQRIAMDAADVLATLRQYEQAHSPFEGPTWNDALALLTATVKSHPDDGFAVLGATRGVADFERAVIRGWAEAELTDQMAEGIIDHLKALDLRDLVEDVARLLASPSATERPRPQWHDFESARKLAALVWSAGATEDTSVGSNGWLGEAINSHAGRLAEFWIRAIASDWRSSRDEWSGLPDATRQQLDNMLAGGDRRQAMVQVVLASQLHFFFAADPSWCESHLLSLFDWSEPSTAERVWDGFLSWGRWSDELLATGLLAHYLAAASNVDQLREELRHQLANHLAAIAIYSQVEPLSWIRRFTANASQAFRVEWLKQVSWTLHRLSNDAAEEQWSRWMRAYWHGRLESIPLMLSKDEASAMAEWTAALSDSLPDAVALAVAHVSGLEPHGDLLRRLLPRTEEWPAACARLLGHLLDGTDPPFWHCQELQTIVSRIRDAASGPDLTAIREHAIRLGCSGAADW